MRTGTPAAAHSVTCWDSLALGRKWQQMSAVVVMGTELQGGTKMPYPQL